jgi:hypothetical protein
MRGEKRLLRELVGLSANADERHAEPTQRRPVLAYAESDCPALVSRSNCPNDGIAVPGLFRFHSFDTLLP